MTAGLGLVHKHCSHSVTGCPSPLFSGKGIFFTLSPDNAPLLSWVGMPGAPGSLVAVSMIVGLCSQDGSQKLYCSQQPLFPSLSWKQEGSGDRGPSLLSRAACLWAPQTHSFPIPSLRRSLPALPHHPTNGPQSLADQSCTTVETRSALPVPTSLSHS